MRLRRIPIQIISFALAIATNLGIPRSSHADIYGSPAIADVATCSVSTVTVTRTPFMVRTEKNLADGAYHVVVEGVFSAVPLDTTFHVTHVSGSFFTTTPQVSQMRLYRSGVDIGSFNVGGDVFHAENSTVYQTTLNQPVDMFFPVGKNGGQYDLQLIRSKAGGNAVGIAEFWGYLTTETCPSLP